MVGMVEKFQKAGFHSLWIILTALLVWLVIYICIGALVIFAWMALQYFIDEVCPMQSCSANGEATVRPLSIVQRVLNLISWVVLFGGHLVAIVIGFKISMSMLTGLLALVAP